MILRDASLARESRASAHTELENDAHLQTLIDDLFSEVEGSDMADYWKAFLIMTDVIM